MRKPTRKRSRGIMRHVFLERVQVALWERRDNNIRGQTEGDLSLFYRCLAPWGLCALLSLMFIEN